MANNNSSFDVLDMAAEYANANSMDVKDLFNDTDETPVEETKTETPKAPAPKEKKEWVPDDSLLEGMDEFSGPVTYDKSEVVFEENKEKVNIAEDKAKEESLDKLNEMERQAYNIEEAKKRHGIAKLQIPNDPKLPYFTACTAAAGDTNHERAQAKLDEILNDIEANYPEFILERIGDDKSKSTGDKIVEIPKKTENETNEVEEVKEDSVEKDTNDTDSIDEVTVVIDKTSLPEVSWTPEDMEKIRKARTVQLNIVETSDVQYSSFEDIDTNTVDAVLSKYTRKTNDVDVVLPASKYRCTIVGLTYPEVIDLSNSQEIKNINGERKKWQICFDHIRNQSIGDWEEYKYYIDPVTKNKVKLNLSDPLPDNITTNMVTRVTKFDDFLMKTSFMDLEYILWNILCATTMDQEIISIDCHAIKDGKECGNNYDWIYRPKELLQLDSINEEILEEMKKTGEVSSREDIIANYKTSMLKTNNTIKLPNSGISVIFGHASAYDYLNHIYEKIKSIEDVDENDPEALSRALSYSNLTVIKGFLVPQDNGKVGKISNYDDFPKVINILDEVDWQCIVRLVDLMTSPYRFRFALTDIICPKCKNRSRIDIDDMADLLFIIAQSLSSVSVEFKSN